MTEEQRLEAVYHSMRNLHRDLKKCNLTIKPMMELIHTLLSENHPLDKPHSDFGYVEFVQLVDSDIGDYKEVLPVGTLAVRLGENKDSPVDMGMSWINNVDQHDKKMGRMLALLRLYTVDVLKGLFVGDKKLLQPVKSTVHPINGTICIPLDESDSTFRDLFRTRVCAAQGVPATLLPKRYKKHMEKAYERKLKRNSTPS